MTDRVNKKPFVEVVTICNKGRRQLRKADRKEGKYPYCGAGGVVEHVDTYTHDGEFLLLPSVGTGLGSKKQTGYPMSGKFHASTNVHVVQAKDGIDSRFLMHYLNWADLTKYAIGVAMISLNQAALKSIPIPVPSLKAQREIVAKIENASEESIWTVMDNLFSGM